VEEKLVVLRNGVKEIAGPEYHCDWVSLEQVDRDLGQLFKSTSSDLKRL
jgi:hypothetical protein